MRIFIILIFFLPFSLMLQAQKQHFTTEDVVANSYNTLAPTNLINLSWIPNTDLICYAEENQFIKYDSKSGAKSELFSLDELNLIFEDEENINKLPKIKWIDENTFSFWKDTNYITTTLELKNISSLISVPSKSDNKTISEQNNIVAFTIENNLFISGKENNSISVTNEIDPNIVSGKSVSRNEFGIKGGIFWSPQGSYLAFYQKDEGGVTDYPIVEVGSIPAKLKNIKYPMTGQTSEKVRVGIYNISNKQFG